MRHFTLALLILLPGLSIFASPVPKDRTRQIDLTGTTWKSSGDTGFGETIFIFHKDGVLEYRYGGNTYRNGNWSQEGSTFTYSLNNNYYVYKGKLHTDEITGKATNLPGGQWEYRLTRMNDQ